MTIFRLLRLILGHPLNRRSRFAAVGRFLRWQVASRLMGTKVVIPFVNESVLLASNGMTGATGNYYCGLHEPNDMGFVLHVLRKGDLFIDVGANIGSYSILAATTGARVISVEPIPETFAHLRQNISINFFRDVIDAHCVGLSDSAGTLRFSAEKDTMNHVVRGGEDTSNVIDVPVIRLDDLNAQNPILIKIDVEGHELAVLNGGRSVLASESLLGVIVEINGNSEKYGISSESILSLLESFGFLPFGYDAMSRNIIEAQVGIGNTIFIRDLARVKKLIGCASKFRLVNGTI